MAPRNNRLNPNAPARSATANLVKVLDTYVQPSRDRMGEQAVAQGFNSMSTTLGGLAKQELNRELTETSRQAQADAMMGDDPNQEFAEVRMGNIFRPHSRAYMEAYNATMGRVRAMEFRDDTALSYSQSGLDADTNPEAFREWYSERLNGFLGDNPDDPFFRAGAMPLLEQTSFNMSAQHTSNIIRTIESNRAAAARRIAADATMSISGEWSAIEAGRIDAVASGNDELASELAARQAALVGGSISRVSTDFYETGDSGSVFRGATLEGVLDVAEATGNTEMLRTVRDAISQGHVRVTPQELLNITNRSQTIQSDRMTQLRNEEYLADRQLDAERRQVADFAADFSGTPEYAGMTVGQILESQPELRDQIMNSPNSSALLQSFREGHEVVTDISNEVPPQIAMQNEADIRAAVQAGEITNQQDAIQWMAQERAAGRVLTAENRDRLMSLAADAGSADSVLGNQLFRNATSTATRTAIADLVVDPIYDATGRATDRASVFLESEVQAYMQDRSGNLNPNSPTYAQDLRGLQEQAVMAAHDAYRAVNPSSYDQALEGAMDEGTAVMSPGFVQEMQNRAVQRQTEVEQAQAGFQAAAEGRELLGVDESGNPIVTGEPDPVVQPQAPEVTSTPPRSPQPPVEPVMESDMSWYQDALQNMLEQAESGDLPEVALDMLWNSVIQNNGGRVPPELEGVYNQILETQNNN